MHLVSSGGEREKKKSWKKRDFFIYIFWWIESPLRSHDTNLFIPKLMIGGASLSPFFPSLYKTQNHPFLRKNLATFHWMEIHHWMEKGESNKLLQCLDFRIPWITFSPPFFEIKKSLYLKLKYTLWIETTGSEIEIHLLDKHIFLVPHFQPPEKKREFSGIEWGEKCFKNDLKVPFWWHHMHMISPHLNISKVPQSIDRWRSLIHPHHPQAMDISVFSTSAFSPPRYLG